MLERYGIRQLDNVSRRGLHVLGETTVNIFSHHPIFYAVVLSTTPTEDAAPTAQYVMHADSVPFFYYLGLVSHLGHNARDLMSESYRQFSDRSDAIAIVNVRTTYPCSPDIDKDVVSSDCRDSDIIYAQFLANSMQPRRNHQQCHSSSSAAQRAEQHCNYVLICDFLRC